MEINDARPSIDCNIAEANTNMASLQSVRDTLVGAYFCDIVDHEEFLLLYDINTSSNPDFQYEKPGYRFELDNFNDDECNSYFR